MFKIKNIKFCKIIKNYNRYSNNCSYNYHKNFYCPTNIEKNNKLNLITGKMKEHDPQYLKHTKKL